jgi:vacuolar-type H+-ATPase subunit C/Vma6
MKVGSVSLASSIDTGQEYVFANLHGRWSGFLRGEELARIVQSASPDLLSRALATHGMPVDSFDRARRELVVHLGEELARVMAMLDPRTAAYYEAFLRRFWYEDLKTVLHVRAIGATDVPVEQLLVDLPALPRLPFQRLMEAGDGTAFAEALPKPHRGHRGIMALVDRLAADGDIPLADAELDRLFFADLMQAAEACPRSGRELACELVGLEIDTANVITLLRNQRTYQLPEPEVLALCIPGGPATKGTRLARLAGMRSPAEVAAMLPHPLSACLRDRALDDLSRIEDDLRDTLFRRARRGFRNFEKPIRTSIAYPYLKWTEIVNLGRVCEGFRFGMLPAEVSPMLIGEKRRV